MTGGEADAEVHVDVRVPRLPGGRKRLLGTLAGLWADRWEHYAMVESFLVLPLGFLSGTFFTLASLPEPAQLVIAGNPREPERATTGAATLILINPIAHPVSRSPADGGPHGDRAPVTQVPTGGRTPHAGPTGHQP